MKKNIYPINLIGCFFCFFLISFFSFHSPVYPAVSTSFDTVQKIYIGYYQRPADPAGLIYWATTVDTNGLAQVIDVFANSAESQELYGPINSGNISTVVNDFYIALFARNAEAAGLEYWVGEFNSGRISAANIMLAFLNGAQNADLQSVNNKLAAATLFTNTIDPELDGLNFQATYAGPGDVIAGRNFLSSVTSDTTTVRNQADTTAYIQTNIADVGDPVLPDATPSDSPCPGLPTVTYAGKSYNTVLIGTQCWLNKNLDVGTMIPGSQNARNNGTIEKSCYNDDPANCAIYGGLYQWNEAMAYTGTDSRGTKGICPDGFHVPEQWEFLILATPRPNSYGDELKAVGQGSGTNTSGFTALLAGSRDPLNSGNGYGNLNNRTYFWTSSSYYADVRPTFYLDNSDVASTGNNAEASALSVRCIKD
jgi:uncharacterized protein (TIGR02145 family)